MSRRISAIARHMAPDAPAPAPPMSSAIVPAAAAAADTNWGGAWGQTYDFNHPPPQYPLCTCSPSLRAFFESQGSGCADNTCKQKLLDGKQVFSYTIEKLDVEFYLEVRLHYDFIWFEMQHSTMTYADVETMIAAGEATGVPGATPFLRIPDELESTLQKATDIGCLGLILPTVDTPEQAQAVAKFARYPPVARRSTGAGQAPAVWGNNYADSYNDNVVVVVMIETPVGVANAYEIANVPGVDVVIIGNFDLHRFSGIAMDDPLYHKMVSDIRDGVVRAGKIFGTANYIYSEPSESRGEFEVSDDAFFFQNGPSHDGYQPPKKASAAIKGYSGPSEKEKKDA